MSRSTIVQANNVSNSSAQDRSASPSHGGRASILSRSGRKTSNLVSSNNNNRAASPINVNYPIELNKIKKNSKGWIVNRMIFFFSFSFL